MSESTPHHVSDASNNNPRDEGVPFTIIENAVIEEYGPVIGPTGLAVYAVLCKFRNNVTRTCFPAADTIAEHLGMARKAIYRALDKLEAVSLIRRTPQYVWKRADGTQERVSSEWEP